MEFHEKLQELRKQRGLTQEELAQSLYVSRAAISKWESGRGYPGIDSLKAIAKYFGVSIDMLLSGDEVLSIAEADQREKQCRFRDLVFGLLDCGVILLVFLPFFGEKAESMVRAVSLLNLKGIGPYLRVAYWAVILGLIFAGVLRLMLKKDLCSVWWKYRDRVSFLLNGLAVLVFVISLQPYAASFLFLFFVIKLMMFQKRP
jgi:transcriptional regulator with XRE-family HTH domain